MSLKPPIAPTSSAGSSSVTQRLDDIEDTRTWLTATGTAATDTANLQAALTAATAGDTIVLSGTFQINAQCSWSSKELHILALGGATLVEASALTVPLLLCTDGDKSSVRGLRVQGIETLAGYGGIDSNRDGIRFDSVDRGLIEDVVVTGKSISIRITGCTRTTVKHPVITGFAATGISGANFHNAVRVSSCTECHLLDMDVQNVGSGVLNDSSSTRINIRGGIIKNHFGDNAVYVSSGNNCKVDGVNVLGGNSTEAGGIKVRGNDHTVTHCTVKTVTIGISATGNGTGTGTPLANGFGTVVANNVIEDTSTDGILINVQDAYYARDFRLEGNYIRNTVTNADGSGAIRVTGNGIAIVNNTIDTCGTTVALITVAGVLADPNGGDTLSNCDISGNKFFGQTNSQDCLRLSRITLSQITRNSSDSTATSDLIDARTVTSSNISGNSAPSMGRVVRLDSASSSNQIAGNKGVLTSGADNYLDHAQTGTPEASANASATRGSRWHRTDGGYGKTEYVKATSTGNTGWVATADGSIQTVATDAIFTLTPGTTQEHTIHTGTLTANRAVTLSTTGAEAGMRFKVTRTGGGAFTLDVGTGPLKALATNTWGEFLYNGSAWILSQYGAL